MGKYDLTPLDIETGINRLLTDAYTSATVSSTPTIVYISAGPGAGKTAVEGHFKREFKKNGERPYIVNSDKIATFHPYYEDALEELPEECYRITRQFVRPAAPIIYKNLMEKKVNIINENTLSKGEYDIELAKKFKENGYKISINVIATDFFESRMSCYERDAAMLLVGLTPRGCSKENQERMYNSFVDGIKRLEELGLCDELNVYVRGENINKPPVLKYSKGREEEEYTNFIEAINGERAKQRRALLANPSQYLQRIDKTKAIISEYGINKALTDDSLSALQDLQEDFIQELSKSVGERE